MGEYVRWDVKVSRETDQAVREQLASEAGKDLSRYVEELVNRELLRQTVAEIHAHNAGVDPDLIEREIEQALAETRKEFWAEPRR